MSLCSVSVIYEWHKRFGNGRKSTEDDPRPGMVRPALWKWLWRTSLFDTFSKNVFQSNMMLRSSNFKEVKSGPYVRIQSFREVFTVLQTRLVKLIVITNCEYLNHFFGLRQLRQPVLTRLHIFWFSRKLFYCYLVAANSLMSTCDIYKKMI